MKKQKLKPEFQLVLHDFGNLSLQIIQESTEKRCLEAMAERMNFLFIQAAKDKQFKAEVYSLTKP